MAVAGEYKLIGPHHIREKKIIYTLKTASQRLIKLAKDDE